MMQTDSNHYDLIVIGGGAAGFFTAIQTAEASFGTARILLLEKSSKTLGKVKISGGGRCNVTHACFDPKQLTKKYPRGEKALIGPFHHFQPENMIDWLEQQGIELKTEADGRMFPVSDNSQTIIDALTEAAQAQGVVIRTSEEVTSLSPSSSPQSYHTLTLKSGETLFAKNVVIATGGTRLKSSASLPASIGHRMLPPVPSLFTFNISDPRLEGIAGVSVAKVRVSVLDKSLVTEGPILVTHWGLSGPAILKLSAWGARSLYQFSYNFALMIDWSPDLEIEPIIQQQRSHHGKRQVSKRSPLPTIPKRLWEKFTKAANIDEDTTWSQLTKPQLDALQDQIHHCAFNAEGKSINKDEFVTCGGVDLKEVSTKTFESKIAPRIYFAGEVLDIDGVTGGFNFQNAWTTAHLAAQSIVTMLSDETQP